MKVISIFCMICSIILMILPYGVPMTWSVSPTKSLTTYHSYFEFGLVAYANWHPFITAVLSVIILLLMLASIKYNTYKTAKNLLIVCIFSSVMSWNIADDFTWISLVVIILHAISCALQFSIIKIKR